MKPVELEIFLQDGLSPGLQKAGEAMNALSADARKMTADLKARVKEEQALVKGVEADVRALEKAYRAATPGKMKDDAHAELRAAKKALEEEKNALRQYSEELAKAEAEQKQYGASLRMELRNLQQEVATLLLAYRSLTEEEKQTAQGRQLAQHIEDLTEKAGALRDAMADTTQAVNNAASDTRGFDQLAGGVQLVVDGFGLATAGAQALGLSEADLMEVQTRLQTALVASNALTSMQTNLQKQSALMQGVAVIQTKAAAAAETIRTWAVGRGTVATKAATIAQAAFNAVAKANPYVLLAMAVTTVVGALYAFAKGSDVANKAEEERQARMEKARQAQEDYRKAVVDAAGGQIASYLRLKTAWENLGDSLDKKRRFITDTKDEWRKLGKEISSVNDMERMFREHSKDMVDAIIIRAELKAYETRIQGVAEEMVNEIEKNKRFTYSKATVGQAFSYIHAGTSGGSTVSYSGDLSKEEQDAIKRDEKRYTKVSAKSNVGTELTAEGAALINEMRKKSGNTDALQRQADARQLAQDKISEFVDTMKGLNDKLDAKMGKLPGTTVNPESSGHSRPAPSSSGEDSRVENERRVNEELRRLRWENEQDEIDRMSEGAEKRRRQIALDYEMRMAEIEKQKREFAAANKESGTGDLNADGLTREQQDQIDRAASIAADDRKDALADMRMEEARHMADYLKEYGTFQQRKLAIAGEYDRKIAEAGDEWTRKTLQKEKDAALQALDIEAIRQSVDWGSVFGSFGTMFKSELEPTIARLKAIAKSDEFRNSDLQDQQTLHELISKLEQADTAWDNDIFNTLGDDLTTYQKAMRDYIAAQEQERIATEALTEAKKELAEAEKADDATAIATAKGNVGTATEDLEAASARVRSFGAEVQDASGSLRTSTARVNNMFSSLVSSLSGLKSGSLQGVGESLMGLDKLFNNGAVTNAVGGALAKGLSKLLGNTAIGKSVAEALGNSGLVGQIISAMLSLLDILKDGMGVLVSDLIDTILGAVSGILGNLLDGKMFVQIGSSLIDGLSGIFDALTFGGFSSWFSSSNAEQVQETIDRLTDRNTALQTAIEGLTDEIRAGRGTKSVAAYRDAYDRQRETNANLLGMAQAQAGYYDAHHSWNYYWEGFTPEQIERLSGQIGRQWDGSLWSLTPEEMAILRENVDMWQMIIDTAGDYGRRVAEQLDGYIAQAGKLEELTDQLHEGLTGMSFDSMYDSFIDQLMDMESSAEDAADDISGYFMRAMLSNKIGELYADKLEEWWHKFGEAMEDNDLTEAERQALADEYLGYVEEALALRDNIAAATGYGDSGTGISQSGKPGSFSAMSQDQGTKLEGLFVSVQGHVANIDLTFESVIDKMNVAEGHLARIAENTGASAGCLNDIKNAVREIIRDGIRTR